MGQTMCIVGDIPEIGNWTNFYKGQMKWSEGHFWKFKLVCEDKVS